MEIPDASRRLIDQIVIVRDQQQRSVESLQRDV
jgi:hypothetical protein